MDYCTIREMEEKDRAQVLAWMRVFYASAAVLSNGSEAIFTSDIDHCVGDCPYLEGYILERDGRPQGYAMVAKSFSTEYGKPCVWIEDLYVCEEARGTGLGSRFLQCMAEKYPRALLRLEVEAENERAVHVYRKAGFDVLPYTEMKKNDRPL